MICRLHETLRIKNHALQTNRGDRAQSTMLRSFW